MSTIDYHLAELAIAQSKDDPRRVLPNLPAKFDSILDIGCGAGQTLIACELPAHVVACGIDIDREPLTVGQRMQPHLHLSCAGGEALPFANQAFDVVISRVSVPYMRIPTALAEINRVLKPGGQIWFTLHPFPLVAKWLWRAIKTGNLKSTIYFCYVIFNGLLFHLFGTLLQFPLNRQRCESFQTAGGMRRALQAAGFQAIETKASAQMFVVQAIKA